MRSRDLMALGALLIVLGCGGGGGGSSPSTSEPSVLFVAASPDASELEFRVDAETAATLGYLEAASQPRIVPDTPISEGGVVTEVFSPGATIALDSNALAYGLNTDWFTVALGLREFGAEFSKRVRLLTAQVDRRPPTGSRARLVLIHALVGPTGQDTPPIDFNDDATVPLIDVQDLPFGSITTLTVDSGSTEWIVRRGDVDAEDREIVRVTRDLPAGSVWLAIVAGRQGDPNRPATVRFVAVPTE